MNEKSKLLFTVSMILIVGAVVATAGSISGSNLIIQADSYLSSLGNEGLTENVSFTDLDGGDMVMRIEDGLIVGVGEAPVVVPDFPSDGLVAYYKLDETNGNYIDSKGNNNISPAGTTQGVNGKIDKASQFNRVDTDYLTISSIMDVSQSNTVCWWMKENITNGNNWILGRTSPDVHWYLVITSSGLQYCSGGGLCSQTFAEITRDKEFHFLCAVNTNGTKAIYEDGMKIWNETQASAGTGSANFYIGRYGAYTTDSFDGTIDELGFWDRALTTNEISDLYNSETGLTYDP